MEAELKSRGFKIGQGGALVSATIDRCEIERTAPFWGGGSGRALIQTGVEVRRSGGRATYNLQLQRRSRGERP